MESLLSLPLSVLNRFGEVRDFDIVACGKIRDGARDFDDAVIGSGGKLQLSDGFFQELEFFLTELTKFFHLLAGHF